MVSGFLTPGSRLRVPDHVQDSTLLQDPLWVKVDGKLVRDAMWFLEYAKDNYWTSEGMVGHVMGLSSTQSSTANSILLSAAGDLIRSIPENTASTYFWSWRGCP